MAKTSSKSKQSQYSSYKSSSRWKSNRERKLKKLLKAHPNNLQIVEALKNIKYRRKTPGTVGRWSKTNIATAKLFKEICGYVDMDVFSSNSKLQAAALQRHSKRQYNVPVGKVSFMLGARAHDKWGNLVWS